jgi:hypothetical protein
MRTASRDRKLALTSEPVAQRLPGHERHHVVQQPCAGVAAIQQRQNVRVLQLRRRADLAQEPLTAQRGAEVRVQDLDGDVTVVPNVASEIDRGHAALA